MNTLLILTLLTGKTIKVNSIDIYDIYIDGRSSTAPNGTTYRCPLMTSMIWFKYKEPICVKELVVRSVEWKVIKK